MKQIYRDKRQVIWVRETYSFDDNATNEEIIEALDKDDSELLVTKTCEDLEYLHGTTEDLPEDFKDGTPKLELIRVSDGKTIFEKMH